MPEPFCRPARHARGLQALAWWVAAGCCALPLGGRAQAAQTATPCEQATPAAPDTVRLLVSVTGAHSTRGSVVVTLYGAVRSRFLAHHGAIALQRVPAGASATACFTLAEPGTYAVAVYHDENDNHKFDRTLLGLPAEGYGFSNNAPTPFGLPSFDAVKFDAAPGITHMSVRLRY